MKTIEFDNEKLQYMDLAAKLQGYVLKREVIESLVATYELIVEKGGEATVRDVSEIINVCNRREADRVRTETLEKFSKKLS